MKIKESKRVKIIESKTFNLRFDKQTGYTEIFGRTEEEDPEYSPFGPIIADIEITDICEGIRDSKTGKRVPCKFCYKDNKPTNSKNMSLETFQKIFAVLPRTLTQIAFGADATGTANPDMWKIFDYCRNNDYQTIVPNVTLADISDEIADKVVSLCGACAVSSYFGNKKKFKARRLKNK